ncbi:MAG: hypothetical protein JKY94_13590 [Rhodobacteraceae bacterium]|nr:hypothetical protein [Paracoccaceae bacterium]
MTSAMIVAGNSLGCACLRIASLSWVGVPLAALPILPLTTIAHDSEEKGSAAARMLFDDNPLR